MYEIYVQVKLFTVMLVFLVVFTFPFDLFTIKAYEMAVFHQSIFVFLNDFYSPLFKLLLSQVVLSLLILKE